MRCLLLCGAVLLAGCGKPGGADKADPPKEDKREDVLPKSKNPLRFLASDLCQHYRRRAGEEKPEPHPQEGKRILIDYGYNPFGVKTADGQRLILRDSQSLFRRPEAVVVLKNPKGFTVGDFGKDVYLEGRVRGLVRFEAKPWSKDWLKLTPNSPPDHFLLIDDAELVAKPD